MMNAHLGRGRFHGETLLQIVTRSPTGTYGQKKGDSAGSQSADAHVPFFMPTPVLSTDLTALTSATQSDFLILGRLLRYCSEFA